MIVILNRRAGSVLNCADLKSKITASFAAAGLQPKISEVDGKEMSAAAKKAVAGPEDIIVAGGGDGTISTIAAELAGSDKILGMLPLGTLNHFAKDLHIPLDLESAVRTIIDRNVATVDLGEVNGRIFINNSSIGIYPHVVHRRDAERMRLRIGKWPAAAWAALSVFRRFPFLDLHIEVQGRAFRRQTAFLFIGNNPYEMTGFRIGKRIRIDTGKLGLYLTHRVGRRGMIRLAVRAFLGHLSQEKDFEAYRVTEACIEIPRRLVLVAADGEVRWMEAPLRYRSRPGALHVLAPRISTG
jgi:diacylglycerol kinase family enzyme